MSQSCNEAIHSELKEQAIDWLVLLRSDEVGDDDLHAFAHWLAKDHAHSEAFAAAEQLYETMSIAANSPMIVENNESGTETLQVKRSAQLSSKLIQENVNNKNKKCQRWFVSAFAIAAVWLFATSLYLPQQFLILDRLTSDHYTQTGEIQDINLSDGSHILLNTNSAVSLAYSNSIRKVILLHGQARFTVAKDPLRPFEVVIDNITVRALGTVFQIYKSADNHIKVIVQEHAVAVSRELDNSVYKNSITVEAGEKLNILSQDVLPLPEEVRLNQATAWQQQRLIINDQPLGELIAELERYRNGRIFLADKELQDEHITGVFSLKDPDTVLNSVVNVLHLKETRLGPWLVLLHRR